MRLQLDRVYIFDLIRLFKPRSIKFKELTQLNLDLPLDSSTSEVRRIVNGKSFGTIDLRLFSARAPCPISLLPKDPVWPISLVAYGGNS